MISIRQALDVSNVTVDGDGNPLAYAWTFVKSETGEIRHIARATRGNKMPRKKGALGKPGGKFRYNHKRAGTILLFDLDEQRYLSIKITHVIKFQGHDVHH